jgi:hypothetical protein
MSSERLNKFEKTEPSWSDIAFCNRAIVAAGTVALLLIAGLAYYVLM